MHVVMTLNGGPSGGSHDFEDNDDVMSGINQTQDRNLRVAMMLYHRTHKGQVAKASQIMFEPEIGEELADLKSAGQLYQIIRRTEDPTKGTVEIVAQYDPPD